MSLAGKRIAITGAFGSLGAAMVGAALEAGATTFITNDMALQRIPGLRLHGAARSAHPLTAPPLPPPAYTSAPSRLGATPSATATKPLPGM